MPISDADLGLLANVLDEPEEEDLHEDPDPEEGEEEEDGGPTFPEGPNFDFNDDEPAPSAPPPAAGDRWGFERAPKGPPVAGYGTYAASVGPVYPPLWPNHRNYAMGATILYVQRRDSSGYMADVGTLPGDGSILDLARQMRKPGTYLLRPVDAATGETLQRDPIRMQLSRDHDVFAFLQEENAPPTSNTLQPIGSGSGGAGPVFAILQGALEAERAEKSRHLLRAERASSEATRAQEMASSRVYSEINRLHEARLGVERSLGEQQASLLQRQSELAAQAQEKIVAEQSRAYEYAFNAQKDATSTQVKLASETAAQAAALAKEQMKTAADSNNSAMTMMMSFLTTSMARGEQDLARQQSQLQIELERSKLATLQQQQEYAARMAAEERRIAQEREDRRLRQEAEDRQRAHDAADRKAAREEAELEERRARLRREEERERREAEREREESELKRLRMEMLEKQANRPGTDPSTWVAGAAAVLTGLSRVLPLAREVLGASSDRSEPAAEGGGWQQLIATGLSVLPALMEQRTRQTALQVEAMRAGLLEDGGGDEDEEDEAEEEEEPEPPASAASARPQAPSRPAGPDPRTAPAYPPGSQPAGSAPPFPAQKRVRDAVAQIVQAVNRTPSMSVEAVQGLVMEAVTNLATDFLAFAQWKGLAGTIREGRPSEPTFTQIMSAIDSYNGVGAEILRSLPR